MPITSSDRKTNCPGRLVALIGIIEVNIAGLPTLVMETRYYQDGNLWDRVRHGKANRRGGERERESKRATDK